jgi:acetoin utilization deacetylase AcuC-like enzyme
MHGEKNYPLRKEASHRDIGLADGTQDKEYLKILEYQLGEIINQFLPDFIIYQCGVDVLKTDQLGRLALTLEGVYQRDKMVLKMAKEIKAPVMCCMGGGYSKQIKDIIEAHAQVYRLAQDLYF